MHSALKNIKESRRSHSVLYHLLYPLHTTYSFFNVFRYITFRTIYATITALVICFVVGPWLIKKLQSLQIAQPIRDDGPKTHFSKKGTPTMGGILIIFAVVISTLLWANLSVQYVWLMIMITLGYGLIGFLDDYKKLSQKSSRGISGKVRLGAEILIALLFSTIVYLQPGFSSNITIPFVKTVLPDLGWGYILLSTFIIVGAANAVNLTDGLDGLAIGPTITCFLTYLLFAYFAGNIKIAGYLQIPYVAGTGELAILCGAALGAGLGFLWYNSYPAEVFMGDVGSLSLGGTLGALAILTKQEILLAIVGGIFVIETFSVIFQVGWFKMSNGQRIFRMAPLHHHFELKGLAEPKVIVRFWIISILLALVAISTLKLR
jgi:phospho-N-acetylmuramoyl-pentapeptide-transferase